MDLDPRWHRSLVWFVCCLNQNDGTKRKVKILLLFDVFVLVVVLHWIALNRIIHRIHHQQPAKCNAEQSNRMNRLPSGFRESGGELEFVHISCGDFEFEIKCK